MSGQNAMTVRCDLCATTFPGEEPEWDAHYLAVHMAPLTPTVWEAQAVTLIVAAARSGRVFTVHEAIAALGDHPDPDQRQGCNGRLTRRVAAQGVMRHATRADGVEGATESLKESSNSSLVRQWIGCTPTTKERAA